VPILDWDRVTIYSGIEYPRYYGSTVLPYLSCLVLIDRGKSGAEQGAEQMAQQEAAAAKEQRKSKMATEHLPPDDLEGTTYLPDVAESGNDWRKSAGDFACEACGKKRLTAMSFSKSQVKKMLAQHKAGGELLGRCLECQAAEPEPEPEPSPAGPPREGSAAAAESLRCTECKADKPPTEYSRKMLTRPKEKRRCKACVDKTQAAEQAKKAAKDAANPPKSSGVGGASVFGTGAARGGDAKANAFRAAMEETAAEAQAVTGISVKRGRGGGGRGRGRGRGGSRFGNSALRRGPSNAMKK
jgi:hypothetical protein